jgi:hypothetical protein
MRRRAFWLLVALSISAATFAQDLIPPEIVRFEKMRIEGEQKVVEMSNAGNRLYSLLQDTTAGVHHTGAKNKLSSVRQDHSLAHAESEGLNNSTVRAGMDGEIRQRRKYQVARRWLCSP